MPKYNLGASTRGVAPTGPGRRPPDGLEIIRPLAAAAPALLRPGGLLALEVGQGQAEVVEQLLDLSGAYSPAEIIPDYQRIGRVVLARRLGV